MPPLDHIGLTRHAGAYAAILRLYLQLEPPQQQRIDANIQSGVDRDFAAGWQQWRDRLHVTPSPVTASAGPALTTPGTTGTSTSTWSKARAAA